MKGRLACPEACVAIWSGHITRVTRSSVATQAGHEQAEKRKTKWFDGLRGKTSARLLRRWHYANGPLSSMAPVISERNQCVKH
jgi:hypothetical protein